MNCKPLCVVAVFGLVALKSHAFPIAAAGTEGFKVFVANSSDIIATYQGNSAAYSNDLYLVLPGPDVFIFNNHASAVGSTVNLGSFAIGTELEFRLHVNNTGDDFYSGPASRNPDGHTHARVQDNWASGTTLVSFEDLLNGPFDYNDLSFSFTNTQGAQNAPDGLSTGLGLSFVSAVMIGLVRLRRRFLLS